MTDSGRLDAAALVSLHNGASDENRHRLICVNSMRRAQPRGQDNGGHCRTLPVAPQMERPQSLNVIVWFGLRLDAGCVTLKPGTGMDTSMDGVLGGCRNAKHST